MKFDPSLSLQTIKYAELAETQFPEGSGIAVLVSAPDGKIGIATNIDCDILVDIIKEWSIRAKEVSK